MTLEYPYSANKHHKGKTFKIVRTVDKPRWWQLLHKWRYRGKQLPLLLIDLETGERVEAQKEELR